MGTENIKTTGVYDREAESLAASYESKSFEEVHSGVLDLVPEPAGLVLDIGAGSGRDAAWFADHEQEVIAVEPAGRMRDIAKSLHPDSRIRWLDDQLPALTNVFRTGLTFDLIWLSAVWMHVPPTSRERAFRKLVTFRKKPIDHMSNSGWRRTRQKAGLPQVRVHDLKHTFGRRLRAAGVSFEDRQDLLGHRSGRMTTHYSAAELTRLIVAANTVCSRGDKKPELVVLRRLSVS